ncbi:hypothetical protein M949_1820 [Riemerella anatipestifer CH3]|nr:hypothetical protein M949_1820 [Riemerella anatipestifer CH3]
MSVLGKQDTISSLFLHESKKTKPLIINIFKINNLKKFIFI